MGQRQFSAPSAPPVTPLKGEGSNEHTLSTFSTFNEYTDASVISFTACCPGSTGLKGRTSWMSTSLGTDLLRPGGDAQAPLRGPRSEGQVRHRGKSK